MSYRLIRPLFFALDAERAHHLSIKMLRLMPVPPTLEPDSMLAQTVAGIAFPNPVGLAAGYDKEGLVAHKMHGLGFGFAELGTLTPLPQQGNPLPRLFRLAEDRAVINRMGFNNEGLDAVAARLQQRPRIGIVGANLGKNKDTEDAASDYEKGASRLAPYCDYMVINVSSPNTPGLRALQGRDQLEGLVGRTRTALDLASEGAKRPPLLLKIAPDLNDEDLADIAAVSVAGSLDGLIVSNTTIARPDSLQSPEAKETGGLSGAPLLAPSTVVLHRMYALTEGKLPLVGAGGIASAADAYAKIKAGASLVQVYSALVYQGTALVERINKGLIDLLAADGFTSITQAIGADHRGKA